MSDQDVQILSIEGWFPKFHNALLSAFPTTAKLKQMVSFQLNENLEAIAAGADHSEVVFNLIQSAKAQGRLKKLLTAARQYNPGNPDLNIFEQDVLQIPIKYKQSEHKQSEHKQSEHKQSEHKQSEHKQSEHKQSEHKQSEQDDLRSNRGVDYTRLRDLLKAGNWKEADEETIAVLLKASGREKDGWLDTTSINNFPWTDLRTINQLWVKYSNGQFGFSVQKRIWQRLKGHPDAPYETWLKFCDLVGWRLREEWINLDVAYNTLSGDGHLPIMKAEDWDYKWSVLRCLFSLPNL